MPFLEMNRAARWIFCAGVLAAPSAPAADFQVFYPSVTQGEFEFENRSFDAVDGNPTRANERNYTSEIGYGVTDYWFGEIENEFQKAPQGSWRYNALGLENVFQLLPQGEEWLDVGFFAEYEMAMGRGASDGAILGPILQKQFGRLLTTLNLFVVADLGGDQPRSPQFSYAVEAKYLLHPLFQPGFQLFGNPGAFTGFSRLASQDNRGGPVIFGQLPAARGTIKYEAGYLVGVTEGAPGGTVKLVLEYETAF